MKFFKNTIYLPTVIVSFLTFSFNTGYKGQKVSKISPKRKSEYIRSIIKYMTDLMQLPTSPNIFLNKKSLKRCLIISNNSSYFKLNFIFEQKLKFIYVILSITSIRKVAKSELINKGPKNRFSELLYILL